MKNPGNKSQAKRLLDRCYLDAKAVYDETLSVEKEIKNLGEISNQDKTKFIEQLKEIASLVQENENNIRKIGPRVWRIDWGISTPKRQDYILNICPPDDIPCNLENCHFCCRKHSNNNAEEAACVSKCNFAMAICISKESRSTQQEIINRLK